MILPVLAMLLTGVPPAAADPHEPTEPPVNIVVVLRMSHAGGAR